MAEKLLITGLANTGKTTLLKDLKDVLVISRDGKQFSLPLPHVNVPDMLNSKGKNVFQVDELLNLINEKLEAYKNKFKVYPKIVAFDSVSRIFTDIENSCSNRFNGYDVWSNINKEVNEFVGAINELVETGINVVLIAHATFDPDSKEYVETCKGNFAKNGGYTSTVDYALNINIVGNKRIITHRGMHLARTLLDELPDKQETKDFSLQEYINKLDNKSNIISEKWSI